MSRWEVSRENISYLNRRYVYHRVDRAIPCPIVRRHAELGKSISGLAGVHDLDIRNHVDVEVLGTAKYIVLVRRQDCLPEYPHKTDLE